MDKPFPQVTLPEEPSLEYWFRRSRALIDFRRGPLEPHFDGFAASLRAKDYCYRHGTSMLRVCRQFNVFLADSGIPNLVELSASSVETFLDRYRRGAANKRYRARAKARGHLKVLFRYLIVTKALIPPRPKPIVKPYGWILNPYLQHLRDEGKAAPQTIRIEADHVASFLEAMPERARRPRFRTLQPRTVEAYIKRHLKDRPHYLIALASSLRRFFRYCALHCHTRADFSGLIPPIRQYRHASLPKGVDDSALVRLLGVINRDTHLGVRNYAILLLLIAYGIRGIAAAELLLDDIDWQHSRITFRARKGGKEVIVPLIEPVGEVIIHWLRQRYSPTPFREVFLGIHAPHEPLTGASISVLVQHSMAKAGFTMSRCGTRTLRHSWAIRALAHDSSIKAIADILGHRYIDTTFIYAKVDLKTLREVAMPWPQAR